MNKELIELLELLVDRAAALQMKAKEVEKKECQLPAHTQDFQRTVNEKHPSKTNFEGAVKSRRAKA